MATIVATTASGQGEVSITETTLTGIDDTFAYKEGVRQRLILRNATVGALTPTITGDGATTVQVAGIGAIDVSGGFAIGEMAADDVVSINTDTIKEYLAGTIDITGGTGLVAILMEG